MYCSNCGILFDGRRCPNCGSKEVRQPYFEDLCFLTERESLWVQPLSDLLKENGIPFLTKSVLGAGITAKLGPVLERVRFYVPYGQLEAARQLEQDFFSADAQFVFPEDFHE